MNDIAKENSGIITIDTNGISLVEKDGDKFVLSQDAEAKLAVWMDFLAFVEKTDSDIRAKIAAAMDKDKVKSIRGENVSVVKRLFGARYYAEDMELAKALGMVEETTSFKLDIKQIEQYQKDTGELPDGIALRDRQQHVVIKKENDEKDTD